MGHFTVVGEDVEAVLEEAREMQGRLREFGQD